MTNPLDPGATDPALVGEDSKVASSSLRTEIEACSRELGRLQRAAQSARLPIVIVIEGWEAAGKGTLINALTLALDSRGFRVISVLPAAEQEPWSPPLHRVWVTLPEAGRLTLYDRSWFADIWAKRARREAKRSEVVAELRHLCAFEQTLVDGGLLLLKFFLQIGQVEQEKRLRRLRKHEFTRWRVDQEARHQNHHFETWQEAADEVLLGGSTPSVVPFVVCPGEDRHRTQLLALTTINAAIAARLALPRAHDRHAGDAAEASEARTVSTRSVAYPSEALPTGRSPLERVELTQVLSRKEYERLLPELQLRLRELEYRIYCKRIGVIVCCEGWDASGKGGNIRRIVSALDPRGYDVHPIAAPSPIERLHHYLWRFWTRIPKAGHIAVFDRTWYGRVLVERVEGFCTEDEWRRAYGEIADFESALVRAGLVLIKFWFHIDRETQLARFRAREQDPEKQWKITQEDWRNRERWSEYESAVNDMLTLNDSNECPYWIVPANDKLYARVFTLTRINEAIELALKRHENS